LISCSRSGTVRWAAGGVHDPDKQIREAVKSGEITIYPFDEVHSLQPASYDIAIGDQGITTSSKEVVDIKKKGYMILDPADFGIVISHEKITLNNRHRARIGLRSGLSRKGIVATTGPQIDPGFSGKLIVGLTNLTPNPVSLPYKGEFLTIEIHRLEEPVEAGYAGPFQGQEELRPEDIALVAEQKGMALSEMIRALASLTSNVASLTNNVASVAAQVGNLKWIVGAGLTLLAVLIAAMNLLRTTH